MSVNPIDENTTPKTTGSLEELFRHHLGEEAAVPPRPMLWDQIDNSLLIRQNEIYRRRLTATRWVAAASLLLATLAGTGWWAKNDAILTGNKVAVRSQPAGSNAGNAAVRRTGSAADGSRQAQTFGSNYTSPAASVATVAPTTASSTAVANGSLNSPAAQRAGATSPSGIAGFRPAATQQGLENSVAASAGRQAGSSHVGRSYSTGRYATRYAASAGSAGAVTGGAVATGAMARTAQPAIANDAAQTGLTNSTGNNAGAKGQSLATNPPATSTTASEAALPNVAAGTPAVAAQSASATASAQMEWLAARNAALALGDPADLPKGLATLALPDAEPAVTADLHKWHYGASYTAGVFNPNVNFSRAGIESEFDYNPALGSNSPALTEAAAAQYRENLRPGLSQRIALLATRHLTGRWSLRTGAEFTQATAKSASSSAFVGEQIPDLGQASKGPLLTTDFRYRLASIPVEVRYANPVKRGWSLYGRLGGVVSALLGVRSEVNGDPEATKTYSFTSAGMPYRRMLASVRGGAGAQFRPTAGNWALTLGPVAELGLVPLNAHPAQSFTAQSRPYSFGIEAGVEFGR